MDQIAELRSSYMSLNGKTASQRVKSADHIESWIRNTMNERGVPFRGKVLKQWKKCGGYDDKTRKRDAFTISEHQFIYAQIKFRQPDSGDDILSAIIQPYYGMNGFKQYVKDHPDRLDSEVWARDYRFDGSLYCSLNQSWTKLRVLDYQKVVKPKIKSIIKEWWISGQNLDSSNREFRSAQNSGFMLKWTKDRGRGSWDSGLEKIVCFMPAAMFSEDECAMIDMIAPKIGETKA